MAGVPTVTVAIGEGFTRSVKAIGRQAGLDLRVATHPGVISTHERPTIAKNNEEVLADQIVRQLTEPESQPTASAPAAEPGERDIVFAGTFEEVNDGIAGSNYGWPTTVGPTSNPQFRAPVYSYQHSSGSPTGCAITGGTFYNPSAPTFGAAYVGTYFFSDYCGNFVWRAFPR